MTSEFPCSIIHNAWLCNRRTLHVCPRQLCGALELDYNLSTCLDTSTSRFVAFIIEDVMSINCVGKQAVCMCCARKSVLRRARELQYRTHGMLSKLCCDHWLLLSCDMCRSKRHNLHDGQTSYQLIRNQLQMPAHGHFKMLTRKMVSAQMSMSSVSAQESPGPSLALEPLELPLPLLLLPLEPLE